MIKIKETLIVEGKYDKNKLKQIFDAQVIQTNGFEIFKNDDNLNFIRELAKNTGIIVLTDSDGAGLVIRNYIKGAINEGRILHAYIPDIHGKEKRKTKPSKENTLGVEGIKDDIIIEAVLNAGATVLGENKEKKEKNGAEVTKMDLFLDGLSGGENSAKRRRKLKKILNLPQNLSQNAMLDAINTMHMYEKYKSALKELDKK